MTATYVGSLSLAAAIPAASAAASAGSSGIGAAMPDLEGRIQALIDGIASLATLPFPSFADMLSRATLNLAGIQAAIALGLPAPPGFSPEVIAALMAALAQLQASLASVQANLALIVGFQSLLGASGIHVIAYDGAIGSLGSELQAALPPIAGHANALALVTTSGASWSAMTQVFKVTP